MLHLPTIPEYKRQVEADVEAAFALAWPKVLGALLDAVVVGLKRLPEVHLERLPRMADFGRWVVACEPACPWEPGAFMAAYDDNRAEAVDIGLEANPFAGVVLRVVAEEWLDPSDGRTVVKPKDFWQATAEQMRQAVADRVLDPAQKRELPRNARAFAVQLKRIAPALRSIGYEIGERTVRGKKIWRIVKVSKGEAETEEEVF